MIPLGNLEHLDRKTDVRGGHIRASEASAAHREKRPKYDLVVGEEVYFSKILLKKLLVMKWNKVYFVPHKLQIALAWNH